MTKNERFREARIKSGKSQDELAILLNVTQPYISSLERDKPFSLKKAAQFANLLNTTAEWLYFGNSTVENNAQSVKEYPLKAGDVEVSGLGSIYNRNIKNEIVTTIGSITSLNTGRRKQAALIPFYNADFMAGMADQFYDDGLIYPEYYMDVPEFSGCTAFRAYSDSMETRIKSGNILFGTKVEDWLSHLEYGQIYGITCLDGRRYLKYIRKSNNVNKSFLLKSENVNYDDFELPLDKIKNIWLIEGWLDKRT